MVFKVYSGRVGGISGDLITVEVDASQGLPSLEMIGLLSSEIKEARDRVRVSLKNNGYTLPPMRITINLSPADEHKSGSHFDLPIAIAILGVFGHLDSFNPEESLIIGELSLDGNVKRVRGILPIVKMARENGFKRVILPKDNAKEGAMIKGIDIIGVSSLSETIAYLLTPSESADFQIAPYISDFKFENTDFNEDCDFSEVTGQENVKRAAGIAAAGFHHLLMTGPPGTGKSLIARRIPTIMPKLTYEESLEVTTIYSIAGKLSEEEPFIRKRPFLSPHHGASAQALTGGGVNAGPGMISLSHRGILFLDELPEFKKETIDYLRQPLEEGEITVARIRQSIKYPARFMLVAAMNPCPCGYYPDRNKCLCTQPQIDRYLSRISGPILDRIDICIEVPRMDIKDISNPSVKNISSEELRKKVEAAHKKQELRYKNEKFKFNSQIPSAKVEKYIPLSPEAKDFLYSIYTSMHLSMRAYYKIIRVAQSIADFDMDEKVEIKHIAEASCYRFPEYMGD